MVNAVITMVFYKCCWGGHWYCMWHLVLHVALSNIAITEGATATGYQNQTIISVLVDDVGMNKV